jgi:hypothetical protein
VKDYLGANRAEQFAKIVLSHGQLSEVELMQEDKCQYYESIIAEEREKLEVLRAKWQELYRNLKKCARSELLQLKTDYEKQLAAVEALRRDPPPLSITKYSAELLQMRRREKAMLRAHRFAEAAGMKEQAEVLQKREDAEFTARWMVEVDQKIARLRFGHTKQVEGRKAFWTSARRELVDRANKETALAEKTIAHLEHTLGTVHDAKAVTTDLLSQNEEKENSLPVLAPTTDERERATAHGQRRLLNHRIYTRTPASNLRALRQTRSLSATRKSGRSQPFPDI